MTREQEEEFERKLNRMTLSDQDREDLREFVERVCEEAFTRGQQNMLEAQ
jgi:hypothetical protein